jgi:hypothetical protein
VGGSQGRLRSADYAALLRPPVAAGGAGDLLTVFVNGGAMPQFLTKVWPRVHRLRRVPSPLVIIIRSHDRNSGLTQDFPGFCDAGAEMLILDDAEQVVLVTGDSDWGVPGELWWELKAAAILRCLWPGNALPHRQHMFCAVGQCAHDVWGAPINTRVPGY